MAVADRWARGVAHRLDSEGPNPALAALQGEQIPEPAPGALAGPVTRGSAKGVTSEYHSSLKQSDFLPEEGGRMRFGEYLMERGLLTSDQVESVLEAQGRTNVWFGTLAYLLDYLDFDDIAEILAVQQRDGGRFGEIAARLGMLDGVQIERILALQEQKRVRFGEMAVALQVLSRERLAALLEEFLQHRESA